MVDKITTVPKTKLGSRVGRLDEEDLLRLNRALLVFLGLAGAAPRADARHGGAVPLRGRHRQHFLWCGDTRLNESQPILPQTSASHPPRRAAH